MRQFAKHKTMPNFLHNGDHVQTGEINFKQQSWDKLPLTWNEISSFETINGRSKH